MAKVKIIATGSYLPKKVLTNFDLEKMVDTSDEWIRTRTGIRERRIADDKEATSDLVVKATHKAIEMSGLKPSEIDGIIVATATPDTLFPSTACWVQKSLGINGIPAFDISAACTGFIYGLIISEALIKNKICKKILLKLSQK